MTRRIESGLKPRAIAVLCCLRQESKTTIQIRNAIGDSSTNSTRDLIGDMRSIGLVGQTAGRLGWYLTEDGVAWLETNGLRADRAARLMFISQAVRP